MSFRPMQLLCHSYASALVYMANGHIAKIHSWIFSDHKWSFFTSFWSPLSRHPRADSPHGWSPCVPQGSVGCLSSMPQLSNVDWWINLLLPAHAVTQSTCMYTACSLKRASSSCIQCILHVFHVWPSYFALRLAQLLEGLLNERAIRCVHNVCKHHDSQVY